jgi:hypothetical protein
VIVLTVTLVVLVVALGTASLSGHLLLALGLGVVVPGLALLFTRGHLVRVRRRIRRPRTDAAPGGAATTTATVTEVVPDDELAPVPLDSRTAAAVTCGLAGLFMFNVLFGPAAIALGLRAVKRGAPGRWGVPAAIAGITLGLLDLLILVALLAARINDGAFAWRLQL